MRAIGLGLACTTWLAAGAACQREAAAQVVDDPLAPIACFEIIDARNIASETALDVCAAATSSAAGQCFAGALDRHHELSSQKIVQLCQRATSLEPLTCYERLAAEQTLTEDQILAYCTTSCPAGPAPAQSSDPACFALALERTTLSDQTIGELCLFSRSPGPAECFLQGQAVTELSDQQLVRLCAQRASCQYVITAPAAE